ncbi:uncharacterized protein [Hemitrygon akajei]|uniref:uncharacterized protein n=1 Tax=Hemitrygon akajei TaxID=2704970 RepID=UPI003BF944B7
MADEKAWRVFEEYIGMILENTFVGTSKRKLEVMGDMIYDVEKYRFGLVELKKAKPTQTPSRCQKEIGRLRREFRSLRQKWKVASEGDKPGLADLREHFRLKLASLRRAESQCIKRKKREKARKSFIENPHQFTKKLFEQSKSRQFNISQQELEDHLASTDSNEQREAPLLDVSGLVKPIEPGVTFNLSELAEVERFIRKARSGSVPRPNGVPYKVFKKHEELRKYSWRLLKVVWRQGVVPLSWSEAEGVYIPKEENSTTLNQFRPISLLNVEGKIKFGILAERVSSFVIKSGLVNTPVQKAGIPGFPGCLVHSSMIWHTIQEPKSLRRNLAVVWLDLANAYGSAPHGLIQFAMVFLWIAAKVRNLVMQYYNDFGMRISTQQSTTRWQSLDVGIPMGFKFADGTSLFKDGTQSDTATTLSPGVIVRPCPVHLSYDQKTLLAVKYSVHSNSTSLVSCWTAEELCSLGLLHMPLHAADLVSDTVGRDAQGNEKGENTLDIWD